MASDFYQDILTCLTKEATHKPNMVIPDPILKVLFSTATESTEAPAETITMSTASSSGEMTAPTSPNWEALYNSCMKCANCRLAKGRQTIVFGEGNPNADLMFIGESPGREEDEQGRPFVGDAGVLLDKMISAMKLDRQKVYIANIVKCRPPGNRNPEPDEAAACMGFLTKQIELVNPRVIVLLGAVPLLFLMNQKGITKLRGKWLQYGSIPVMPTFHPAYLLRYEAAKREVWTDLKAVMKQLGL